MALSSNIVYFSQYPNRHPGCDCPKGFQGENCQYVIKKDKGLGGAGVAAVLIVAMSLLSVFFLLRVRRRQRMSKLYDSMARDSSLPPSLDLMQRSLQVDMEYGEPGSDSSFARRTDTPPRARPSIQREELLHMRKSEWPNGRPDSNLPNSIFNDIPLSPMGQAAIITSRKKEWPNGSHNDATNPIHIFDDISVSTPDLSIIPSSEII